MKQHNLALKGRSNTNFNPRRNFHHNQFRVFSKKRETHPDKYADDEALFDWQYIS